MVSFLFWNIQRRPVQKLVAEAAHELDVDVIMLAECEIQPAELLTELGLRGHSYCVPFSESEKITVATRFAEDALPAAFDDPARRLTIRRLLLPDKPEVLLAVVHFPSKASWSEDGQAFECGELAQDIERFEERRGHHRTVLVGDFNMNPFEKGVVAAHGLHAVMTKRVADKVTRVVNRRPYRFFYNPMWGCFGDRTEGAPGTLYYDRGDPVTYFWNMYDQVLVRPDLSKALVELRIITQSGGTALTKQSGVPDPSVGSDHFPVLFRLDY